jgi:hypothetical protein
MKNWLKLGDYNAICDSCGRKFKASTMSKRWDGLFVCKEDLEPRHPQLSLRVKGDIQTVPIPRPEPVVDTFLAFCDVVSSAPMADFGTVGCISLSGTTSMTVIKAVLPPQAKAGSVIAGRVLAGG